MSEEALLDDLEAFVNGDWKTIHAEHEAEEYRKEINEPVIPAIPTFEEFYKLLILQIGRPDIPPELEYLIHRIITYQEKKSTKSFENVWSMFCDPSKYSTMEKTCKNCNKELTVITEGRGRLPMWREGEMTQAVMMNQEHVYCPQCGYCIMITTGKVVGVFSN